MKALSLSLRGWMQSCCRCRRRCLLVLLGHNLLQEPHLLGQLLALTVALQCRLVALQRLQGAHSTSSGSKTCIALTGQAKHCRGKPTIAGARCGSGKHQLKKSRSNEHSEAPARHVNSICAGQSAHSTRTHDPSSGILSTHLRHLFQRLKRRCLHSSNGSHVNGHNNYTSGRNELLC